MLKLFATGHLYVRWFAWETVQLSRLGLLSVDACTRTSQEPGKKLASSLGRHGLSC